MSSSAVLTRGRSVLAGRKRPADSAAVPARWTWSREPAATAITFRGRWKGPSPAARPRLPFAGHGYEGVSVGLTKFQSNVVRLR